MTVMGSMQVRKLSAVLTAIAVISAATTSWSQEPGRRPQVPVVIEADPDTDACGGNGVVEGLDPLGDGFLAVRSGPGPKHAEIDRLYNSEEVYFCTVMGKWFGVVYSNQRQHCNVYFCTVMGKWFGVVYSNQRQHCNVTAPWISTQPSTWPCKSGWVHQKWVRLYAG
nr:hypothetical protein [Sinorhizobium medicae]